MPQPASKKPDEVLTKLTTAQAEYLNVPAEGP